MTSISSIRRWIDRRGDDRGATARLGWPLKKRLAEPPNDAIDVRRRAIHRASPVEVSNASESLAAA
jgi:hypothetical protein